MNFRTVYYYTICLSFAITLANNNTSAQNSPPPEFYLGLTAGYSQIRNFTDLPVYYGSRDCAMYNQGTAQGLNAGLTADYVLFPKFFEISGRLLYAKRPVSLRTETDNGYQVNDPASDSEQPLRRGYNYTGGLGYIMLDLGLRSQPLRDFPLYLRLSLDAGNPLASNYYEQTEEIVSPQGFLFPDETQRHTIDKGEITGAGTSYGAIAALGGSFELRPRVFLEPEISFRKGLNSVISTADWRTESWQAAVGIRYEFRRDEEKPLPKEETKQGPPPVVVASINTRPLEVEETIVTQTFPLLPYIFFDSTDTQLRSKYLAHAAKEGFSEDALPKETLPIYYSILPIIGSRLQRNPGAKISITGNSDGREAAGAEERKKIAENRARAIKEYFLREWNIDPKRMQIVVRELPELASSAQYSEGNEENRRVEIYSDNADILAPVLHSKFQEFTPVESRQKFSVVLQHPERVKSWDLAIFNRDNLVNYASQDGVPGDTVSIRLPDETMKKLGPDISVFDSLRGELQIVEESGRVIRAECRFPIVRTQSQFELSRLSLIVFDFDRAEITAQNREMMSKFAAEAFRANSTGEITGSTDRLGEAKYNESLSQMRAESVNSFLHELKPDARILSVRGIGASQLSYDNNLPEGRYYCRTVSLLVKTPREKDRTGL